MLSFKKLVRRAAVDAAALTLTTTAAMMAASQIETGSPFSAVNNICHMIDGDDHAYGNHFDTRDTLLGVASNASAMIAWSGLHEMAFGELQWPLSAAAGIGTAAAAYMTDYHLVPKRFTPGIEHKLGPKAIASVYFVLAGTLILAAAARSRQ